MALKPRLQHRGNSGRRAQGVGVGATPPVALLRCPILPWVGLFQLKNSKFRQNG